MNEPQQSHPRRADFRFSHRLRVRWSEVDMQKIVFNAHYLTYFDIAIGEYWRALALPYEESMAALDGDLYVRKATLEFEASARMDDLLDVRLKCRRVGTASMTFAGALFRGETLLVTCELVYVFADPSTQTSRPVPAALRTILERYENGASMRSLRLGDWQALGRDASATRRAVFVREQGIPEDLEWDENDATALHVIASNGLGRPIGTGRLATEAPGVGRIGRMAVHRALRGGGHGAAMVRALEEAARARGDHEVVLHAQRDAEAFYTRLGYAPQGEPFEEAGIAHIEMHRTLQASDGAPQMSSSNG